MEQSPLNEHLEKVFKLTIIFYFNIKFLFKEIMIGIIAGVIVLIIAILTGIGIFLCIKR